MIMAASVMMFGIELPSKNLFTLTPQWPGTGLVGENRFQKLLTGVH